MGAGGHADKIYLFQSILKMDPLNKTQPEFRQ